MKGKEEVGGGRRGGNTRGVPGLDWTFGSRFAFPPFPVSTQPSVCVVSPVRKIKKIYYKNLRQKKFMTIEVKQEVEE